MSKQSPCCVCGGSRVLSRTLFSDTAFDCEGCGALLCGACMLKHDCPEREDDEQDWRRVEDSNP